MLASVTFRLIAGIPERSALKSRLDRGEPITLNINGVCAGPPGVGIGVQVIVDGRLADEFALGLEPLSTTSDLAPILKSSGMVLLAPPCDVVLKPFVTTPRKEAPADFEFTVESVNLQGV